MQLRLRCDCIDNLAEIVHDINRCEASDRTALTTKGGSRLLFVDVFREEIKKSDEDEARPARSLNGLLACFACASRQSRRKSISSLMNNSSSKMLLVQQPRWCEDVLQEFAYGAQLQELLVQRPSETAQARTEQSLVILKGRERNPL